MLLRRNQRFVFQRVGDDVAAHEFPPFVVKVVEERAEVLQGQQGQHVVVGVHGDLHQPHQLLGHHAAVLQAETRGSSRGADVTHTAGLFWLSHPCVHARIRTYAR